MLPIRLQKDGAGNEFETSCEMDQVEALASLAYCTTLPRFRIRVINLGFQIHAYLYGG